MLKQKQERKIKRCKGAWFLTAITGYPHYHSIAPCTYLPENLIPIEDPNNIDMDIFWNGEEIKNIRRLNVNNSSLRKKTKINHCANCVYYNSDNEIDYLSHFSKDVMNEYDENWTQDQKDNVKLAQKEFLDEKIELKSSPILISFLQGIECNLNCRMCFQRAWNKKDFNRTKGNISAKAILKLKPYLKRATHLSFVGGEPLFIKESVELIKALIEDPDYQASRITIWTNGMLLDKHIETLKKHKKISIFTSPNATGETYEYIRRGGNWQKLESNLKLFMQTAKENNLDWELKTHNLLMKSSIDKIEDFAKWSVENNIEACFSVLWSSPFQEEFNVQEDVLLHPELLDTISDWELKLKRAIEIFESGHQEHAVKSLLHYSKKISTTYLNFKNGVTPKISNNYSIKKLKIHQKITREILYFFNKTKTKLSK